MLSEGEVTDENDRKTLSIFIDESGTYGNCESYEDKYVVGLVFHDQDIDISTNISNFKSHLEMLGQKEHAVHTAPLIRREEYYANDLRENRIKLFSSLFNCARKMPIRYSHILIHKRECSDVMQLTSRLSTMFYTLLELLR